MVGITILWLLMIVNFDELKYSLRSVEKFAPWINHIYIITDNQVPAWLNTDNPKITIIDHTEIMPKDALPVFNSLSIECSLDKIKNLSEYFLYANDDMFFADYAEPEFFYNKDGYPIIRLKKYKKLRPLYGKLIKNAQNVIKENYNKFYNYIPHHSIDAYRKSTFSQCSSDLANVIKQMTYSRFRNENNCERVVFLYYALATKQGHLKIISRIDSYLPWYRKIMHYFLKIYKKDTVIVQAYNKNINEIFEKYKPILGCINDKPEVTDQDRARVRAFYEKLFPQKSSYEK